MKEECRLPGMLNAVRDSQDIEGRSREDQVLVCHGLYRGEFLKFRITFADSPSHLLGYLYLL